MVFPAISNTDVLLQPVMPDTGGQIVQKHAIVETETAAAMLRRASATVRLVTLEHTAIRVCGYVSITAFKDHSVSWFQVSTRTIVIIEYIKFLFVEVLVHQKVLPKCHIRKI